MIPAIVNRILLAASVLSSLMQSSVSLTAKRKRRQWTFAFPPSLSRVLTTDRKQKCRIRRSTQRLRTRRQVSSLPLLGAFSRWSASSNIVIVETPTAVALATQRRRSQSLSRRPMLLLAFVTLSLSLPPTAQEETALLTATVL